MEKVRLAISAELSVIAHATESVEKACIAAKNMLPKEFQDNIAFKQRYATGHHGNPIASIRAIVSDRNKVERLITELASRISSVDRTILSKEFDRFLDKDGNLYLRFDKQAAYHGEILLKQEDSIRIKVRFLGRPRTIEAIYKACKEMGLVD